MGRHINVNDGKTGGFPRAGKSTTKFTSTLLEFHLFWAMADKATGVCLRAARLATKGAALRIAVAKKVIMEMDEL